MKKTRSYACILLAAALWGCIGLFYKHLSALGMTPLQVVFVRTLTALLLLGIYLLLRDLHLFRIRLRDIWMFIGTGIVSLAFFNYCYFNAMDRTSLSVAAVLLYTAPIFVMLFSAALFKEKLTLCKLFALLMTFLGCMLVTGVLNSGGTLTADGILFGLGAGIGYALYSIFGVYALRRYASETVTFYTFLFATIAVLPLCEPLSLYETIAASPMPSLLYSISIGIFACLLPYLLYTKGLAGVPAGQAAVIATVEPVVATVIDVCVYRDALSLLQILGMLLILAAIVLLNIRMKQKETGICNGKS